MAPEFIKELIDKQTLVNAEQAAHYLGGSECPISQAVLAEWRSKKIGPSYIKIGRLVRYRISALDEWMESRIVCTNKHVEDFDFLQSK